MVDMTKRCVGFECSAEGIVRGMEYDGIECPYCASHGMPTLDTVMATGKLLSYELASLPGLFRLGAR